MHTHMPLAKLSTMGEKVLQHNDQAIVGTRNAVAVLAVSHSRDIYRK